MVRRDRFSMILGRLTGNADKWPWDRFRKVTVLLTVLFALVACDASATGSGVNSTGVPGVTTYPARTRLPAPSLVGETLNGQSVSLRSFDTGHIVVINVWASWCAPCRSESPMLAKAAQSLRSEGIRFLGVDEEDSSSHARTFVASTGATYPNLIDKEGSLLRKLTVLPQAGIPSTLVLDVSGRMAARVIGPITSRQLQQIVKGLREKS
jgi:thiol-disulfide isomerase/thioredoxin